jgi:hypothetical protein
MPALPEIRRDGDADEKPQAEHQRDHQIENNPED